MAEDGFADGPLAAVDLGSNSFHLVVGEVVGGKVRIVDRLKERVALAEGLDDRRQLDEDSQARAISCLARFGERLVDIPPDRLRAAGTNTLRAASNAGDFLARANEALGHEIDIIEGPEEARLVYLGVARTQAPGERRRLVVDIGGGSTECVVGEGFEVLRADSLRMGCVTFTKGFFPGGKLNRDRFDAARFAASVELEPIVQRFAQLEWRQAIGSSGTILAVSEMLAAAGHTDGSITPKGIAKLRDDILEFRKIDEISLPALAESRRPVIAAGLAILLAVVEQLGVETMETSEGALREGLLYDMLGRTRGEDPRDQTVAQLQHRFAVDKPHAAAVEETFIRLFDQVAADWDIDERRLRRAGEWASRVHEIGLTIRHGGYHKHGAYLIEHTDLPGFARLDQLLVAKLVLNHRRKFRHEELEALGKKLGPQAVRVSVLLRLAALLNRSRSATIPEVEATAPKKRKLELGIANEWLESHPLLEYDLEEEQARLERGSFKLSFEK
jgi:exopolyphosphatase/guanosine-5'-triphosphate,3'-diphosphate pyrophosphatase